jgi:hypothetical protein
MKFRWAPILAAPWLMAVSSPTAIQKQAREDRLIVSAYGDCLVKKRPQEAAEAVLGTEPSGQIMKIYHDLSDSDCLNRAVWKVGGTGGVIQMGMPGEVLHYALAEALIRREYSAGLPPDIALAAPRQQLRVTSISLVPKPGQKVSPEKLEKVKELNDRAAGFEGMAAFGECVARQSPSDSLQLILTKPASAQEDQQFSKLGHTFADCLPAGQTLALDRSAVRGTIAMNLYQLAKAPRINSTPAATQASADTPPQRQK